MTIAPAAPAAAAVAPAPPAAVAAPDADPARPPVGGGADEGVLADVLVEEISIDGMCGVY